MSYAKGPLSIDISCKIFSYFSPLELYFAMHKLNRAIRKSAYFELSKAINSDIDENCNVYYTSGLPVGKEMDTTLLPFGRNVPGIGTYLFKSVFHTLIASEKALRKAFPQGNNTAYQVIFKVIYPQKNDYDFNKEKKRKIYYFKPKKL